MFVTLCVCVCVCLHKLKNSITESNQKYKPNTGEPMQPEWKSRIMPIMFATLRDIAFV